MQKTKTDVPFGYELKPKTKSAHLQLLLVPETLELLRALAAEENTSMNELANQAIIQLLKDHGKIEK